MAMFGGLALSVILLYDLFTNKQKIEIPLIIIFIALGLIYIQFSGITWPHNNILDIISSFKMWCGKFLLYDILGNDLILSSVNCILKIVILITVIFFINLYYIKSKSAFFFILTTYISLFMVFSLVYSGNFYHYYYFYLYLLVSIWLYRLDNNYNSKLQNIFLLCVLFLLNIKTILFQYIYNSTYGWHVYNDSTKSLVRDYNINNFNLSNAKLYMISTVDLYTIPLLPYLDMPVYDVFGNNHYSIEGYKYNMLVLSNYNDKFVKSLNKNKRNIIISYKLSEFNDFENFVSELKKSKIYKVKFVPTGCFYPYCIIEIKTE